MPNKSPFEYLNKNLTKYQIDISNYIPPSIKHDIKETRALTDAEELIADEEKEELDKNEENEEEKSVEAKQLPNLTSINNIIRFQTCLEAEIPKICVWDYMNKEELEIYLKLNDKKEIRNFIENEIGQEHPKGFSRLLLRELIYTVTKFCKSAEFDLKQCGAVLSIFYLTHRYFNSSFLITAEKAYKYFKDRILLHCLEFPPDSIKIFTYDQSRKIILFFCSIYLRNLPLIRLLTMPNVGFYLNYELEPEPAILKKGKKDKKDKGKKN